MAQNITLLGANYSAVPAVTLPKTGGGTARFDDASVTTATASDVTSGKVFLASDGTITTGTNSGGGASNIVTGTFIGTTTGKSKAIKLTDEQKDAVAFIIYPTAGGYNPNSVFYSTVQRYAVQSFYAFRNLLPVTDTSGTVVVQYKSSTSSATSYSRTGSLSVNPFAGAAASSASNVSKCVKTASGTFLYVYIASTSYGFMANVEYTYHVIFDS